MAGKAPRRIIALPRFLRSKRRLTEPAQLETDVQVGLIDRNPLSGEPKVGALRGVRVVKFTVKNQPYLLAYHFLAKENVVELLDVAPHENFYRDLQRYLDR